MALINTLQEYHDFEYVAVTWIIASMTIGVDLLLYHLLGSFEFLIPLAMFSVIFVVSNSISKELQIVLLEEELAKLKAKS